MNYELLHENDVDMIVQDISDALYQIAEVNRLKKLRTRTNIQFDAHIKQLEQFAVNELKENVEWLLGDTDEHYK